MCSQPSEENPKEEEKTESNNSSEHALVTAVTSSTQESSFVCCSSGRASDGAAVVVQEEALPRRNLPPSVSLLTCPTCPQSTIPLTLSSAWLSIAGLQSWVTRSEGNGKQGRHVHSRYRFRGRRHVRLWSTPLNHTVSDRYVRYGARYSYIFTPVGEKKTKQRQTSDTQGVCPNVLSVI